MTTDTKKELTKTETMVVRMGRELTRHNPRVQSIALRMGWRSETLIDRVKNELPSPIEQHVYLSVARSISLLPKSLKRILRHHLGDRELSASDLVDRQIGDNTVSNVFNETMDHLEVVLVLMNKSKSDLGLALSIEDSSDLASIYGDYAEAILDSIASQIDPIRSRLGMRRLPDVLIFFLAVKLLLKHTLVRGAVSITNFMDLFDEIEYSSDDIMKILDERDGNDE